MNFYLDKNNTKTSWNPTSKYFNLVQRQSYNGWLTQTGDNQRRLLRSDHHIPSSDCSISCSLLSSTAGGWWPGNTTCPASPADPVHTPHSSLLTPHSTLHTPLSTPSIHCHIVWSYSDLSVSDPCWPCLRTQCRLLMSLLSKVLSRSVLLKQRHSDHLPITISSVGSL